MNRTELDRLANLLQKRYDSDFRERISLFDDQELGSRKWREYLKMHGMETPPKECKKDRVKIMCHKGSETLLIPDELALKCLVLGEFLPP